MITTKPLLAKPSKLGHKGFQYPDFTSTGVLIPKETPLTQLPWIPSLGWTAWAWADDRGTRVVWLKDDNKVKEVLST